MGSREDLCYLNMPSLLHLCSLQLRGTWIARQSLVFWTHCRAAATLGIQLVFIHLPPIQWLGQYGTVWDQLEPALFEVPKAGHQHGILFLHLGENDLAAYSAVQLLNNLTRGIAKIRHLMPGTMLVWADILSSHNRHGAHSNRSIGQRKDKQVGQ